MITDIFLWIFSIEPLKLLQALFCILFHPSKSKRKLGNNSHDIELWKCEVCKREWEVDTCDYYWL